MRLSTLALSASAAIAVASAMPSPAARAAACEGLALAPFADWAGAAFGLDRPPETASDGRLVISLDNGRADRLRLSHDAAGGEIALAVETGAGGADARLAVDAAAFSGLLLRCVRFEGFGADDRVHFDGVDAGFVARHWRIPHRSIGETRAPSPARNAAIAHIERRTDHGARGVALQPPSATVPDGDAVRAASRATVAILINADAYANTRSGAKIRGESRHVVDVGGGTLLRIGNRLVVVTAAHIVPRWSPRRGILALTSDGVAIPLHQLLHGGRRYDLAVFGIADPAQEADLLKSHGGVRLAEPGVARHAFTFHIGFPDGWQTNDRTGPVTVGAIDLPWLPKPVPVMTSGLVTGVEDVLVRASARIAQGDSGGGFFVLSPEGEPLLIGPTSTVRGPRDGNPPDTEVDTPVTGGIFRLHVFDLISLMPNYFAAAPGPRAE